MALVFYRISRFLYRIRVPILPKFFTIIGFLVFGSYVPASCEIGSGTRIAYGGAALVIHARARIGQNCLLSPGVVIGGRAGHERVPVIGDEVELYPGCKILGPVTVGDRCRVAANAVVIEDMAPGTTAVPSRTRFISS